MLVLSRRKNQKLVFPTLGVAVEVVEISGKTVRLGVDAPREIRVIRDELKSYDLPQDKASQDELQAKLDAANLAVHLAQNQLQSGLNEYAEEALKTAMECIATLDDSLRDHLRLLEEAKNSPKELNAVCEASQGYKVSSKDNTSSKAAWVIGGNASQRSSIAMALKQSGLEVQTLDCEWDAIKLIGSGEFASVISMVQEQANVKNAALVELPVRFCNRQISSRRFESCKIGGIETCTWSAADFQQ